MCPSLIFYSYKSGPGQSGLMQKKKKKSHNNKIPILVNFGHFFEPAIAAAIRDAIHYVADMPKMLRKVQFDNKGSNKALLAAIFDIMVIFKTVIETDKYNLVKTP